MQLRDYQSEAVAAVIESARRGKHSLACLPTGSGKSLVIAELCRIASGRVLVVTHSRELVRQDYGKITALTSKQVGIYCAGLGEKDATKPITVASVQSIVRANFAPFSAIIVDECHKIPFHKNGQYHSLFAKSPNSLIIGMTATAFRLDGGMLHEGNDALFDEIAYEAKTGDLIEAGWLSPVVGYRGGKEADLTGVHTKLGEFVTSEMAERFEDIAEDTVNDIIEKSDGRKAVLVFCAGIAHAKAICGLLYEKNESVAYVDGSMPSEERDGQLARFNRGEARIMVNCEVLAVGYDSPRIDCIALLRATKSASWYVQAVGRGLRLSPGKTDCMILDYGGNIRRHGPLDEVWVAKGRRQEKAMTKTCPRCKAEVSLASRVCRYCGNDFPVQEREVKHARRADDADPMSAVQTIRPESVTVVRHKKPGRPDSLRVTYHAGLLRVSEWVCLDHPGYAGDKARAWWRARFPSPPPTVNEALGFLFLPQQILSVTESIEVGRDGKYPTIKTATIRRTA